MEVISKANDLVLVTRTNEIFLVSSVSSNTLTVVREYGSASASTMNDNDELFRVGNAFEEGAGADISKTVKADSITNYCEIFKTSLTLTGTEMQTTLYGGADLPLRHKMSGIEHAVKMEMAFLYGQKVEYLTSSSTNPTTSHPKRLTGGILNFISSNAVSVAGALTENVFNQNFLRPMFDADHNFRQVRTVFVSSFVAGIINSWANNKIRLVPSDKTFGIKASQYHSAYGDVMLILHPLLRGDTYKGYMIGVDMRAVGFRYLVGRNTKLSQDIVRDGTDQRVDEFLTEAGFMVRIEGVHGYASGITS